MGYVFLSHNSSDKPAVEEIARRLRERGLEPWLDAWQLVPGRSWQPDLEKALAEAEASVVFFGPSGMGPWQAEEMRVAIDRRVRDARYRVVPVLLPGTLRARRSVVPPFLANVTWVEFPVSLDDAQAFDRLVAGIEGRPPQPAPSTVAIAANPYLGLHAFDMADSAQFFGRNALTGWLLSALRASLALRGEMRFLAIVGPSGSGKSSVARAGLMAALRDGALPGSGDWPRAIFKPGAHPLEALALALAGALGLADGPQVLALRAALATDPRLLHVQASLALRDAAAGTRLVLLVDQFEEVFTLCESDAERRSFIDNLLNAAAAADGPAVVVVTIRADFVGSCTAHERLAAALSDHQVLVGPMRPEDLRDAIEQPAQRAGCEFQPGLVDTLLDDVGAQPGSLPLLQHALLELWRLRDGRRLTHAAYERVGRVQGALARRADEVYDRLAPQEQALARRLLLRLTQPGEGTEDTRRRASMDEIAPSTAERALAESVVRRLADERLLVTDGGMVDVAHEALIRGWPRLREWIEGQRTALRFHRRITEATLEWNRLDRDEGLLFRGRRLDEARVWRGAHDAELNALERAFLDASDAAAARAQRDKAAQRAQSGRILMLQWGLASALGLCAAVVLATYAAGLIRVAYRLWDGALQGLALPDGLQAVLLIVAGSTVVGSVLGGVLGAAQWFALGRAVPGIRGSRWIVATALGMSSGLLFAAVTGFALQPDDPLDRLNPGASQGVLAIAAALALLVMFVRHRQGVGATWDARRKRMHWGVVAAIALGVAPALVPRWTGDLVILGTRLHEATAAGLLATLTLLFAWHHITERPPRTLGRMDLYGAFLAAVALLLPLTYLLRVGDLRERMLGDPYGLPGAVLMIVWSGMVGAIAGIAQGFVLREAGVRVVQWAAACGMGLGLGMAITASLIPQLGTSIGTSLRLAAFGGVAEIIFFAPVGLVFGAVTGDLLLRSMARRAGPDVTDAP